MTFPADSVGRENKEPSVSQTPIPGQPLVPQRARPNRADDAERNEFIDEKAVDELVKHVMSCKDVPGLSVAVVKDGKSWTKGFGLKDLVKKTPVDTSTLFGIGSLTKAFTSALLAVALEEANRKGRK